MNFEERSSCKYSVVCLVLVITIGAFTSTSGQTTNENLKKLATANNVFALNLHRIISAGSEENVFFSPLSLSTVFGMLYYGVRGETAKELRQALGYDDAGLPDEEIHSTFQKLLTQISKPSIGYSLLSANAILVAKDLSLRHEYKRGVQQFYHTPVEEVNFARDGQRIVRIVNGWVEEKTRGMIRQVIKTVDPLTTMVLLNAVYFKGKWKTPFHPLLTNEQDFYNGGLEFESKKVSMMYQGSANFPYTVTDDYQAVELPYVGDDLSMLILLPKHRDGLPSLERNLTSTALDDILQNMSSMELEVHLPMFSMEFSKDLPPMLQQLGIDKVFRNGTDDFSGISARDSKNLFVSDVVHKSKIQLNEEGTEAASVSALFLGSRSTHRRQTIVFRADHPFLFFILDRSNGLILFMGRVSKL